MKGVEGDEFLYKFAALLSRTPTMTSRPAFRNFWMPLPATLENGSWQPITILGICFSMIRSAQEVSFHDGNKAQGLRI